MMKESNELQPGILGVGVEKCSKTRAALRSLIRLGRKFSAHTVLRRFHHGVNLISSALDSRDSGSPS